jgi:predicted dehydrogenase
LEEALGLAQAHNPGVTGHSDYRRLLDSKDIDAVVIATPDHWHAQMTVDAAEAGKDVYVEKGMTRTVEEAEAIVSAVKRNRRVLQLGHQRSSDPVTWKAKKLFESGKTGQVSLVKITRYRNSRGGEWNYPIPADGVPPRVDWFNFLGGAPARPFDADRFFRWRKYWDYGTGISGDLLSHEWNAANLVLGLGIPNSCVASGGVYFWNDGREVPDVLHALFEYPDRNLSVCFSCTFSNSRCGEERETHIFGRDATIRLSKGLELFLEPHGVNRDEIERARADRRRAGEKVGDHDEIPVLGTTRDELPPMTSHLQNFIDCVRSRERTRCNEDDGFEEAVTLVMSVLAYRERRMVRWNPVSRRLV